MKTSEKKTKILDVLGIGFFPSDFKSLYLRQRHKKSKLYGRQTLTPLKNSRRKEYTIFNIYTQIA